MTSSKTFPTLNDIKNAAERIAGFAHRTPILTNETINKITGGELFFKCENFQKVGAFKFRGGCNAVQLLSDAAAAKGVATHSSGNHAQAIALAAKMRNIPAYIVMPETAPKVKIAAVKNYGAEITFCEATLAARETTLTTVVEKTGAEFIHPFDDWRVVCGQATAALEVFEDINNLNIMMVPVGGGGLMSGTALITHYISPKTKMIAAEPVLADDAYRSFKLGKIQPPLPPTTIADGLLTSLSDRTFAVMQAHVDDVVTVTEENIVKAMRLIWERMKIIIEPSCAVPLAAILEKKVDVNDKRVAIILTGGNVDLGKLPW